MPKGVSQYLPPQLIDVLNSFVDIFQEPSSLPPVRSHDHRIPLKEGSNPINIHPYRYGSLQKDIIEKMTTKLLDAGVIQPSSSPFASPMVLMKEEDNS